MKTEDSLAALALSAQERAALETARAEIEAGSLSCAAVHSGEIAARAEGMGLRPLLSLYEQSMLADAFVVDKIIGKAAAMILVLGRAKKAYGETVSASAAAYLHAHGIPVAAGRVIERIINRAGTGLCPMEQTVLDIDDPAEGLIALKGTIERLRAAAPRPPENP